MGSRHNRKRTRSRPRNRKPPFLNPANPHSTFWTSSSPSAALPSPFSPTYAEFVPKQAFSSVISTSQWADRVQKQQRAQSERHEAAMETERMRMFGGEKGDPISLCAPMLQVVMDLFEGNVDYEDP